jgi:hypothetical protein
MIDRSGKSDRTKKDTRQDRLKQALRENLKRRKAQERARSQLDEGASGSGQEAPPHGQVGKSGD